MFVRAFLALLMTCLALPALAGSPHDAPVVAHHAMMAGMHHGDDAPAPPASHHGKAAHDCIGCIPPIDGVGAVIAASAPIIDRIAVPALYDVLAGRALSPELRPPQIPA